MINANEAYFDFLNLLLQFLLSSKIYFRNVTLGGSIKQSEFPTVRFTQNPETLNKRHRYNLLAPLAVYLHSHFSGIKSCLLYVQLKTDVYCIVIGVIQNLTHTDIHTNYIKLLFNTTSLIKAWKNMINLTTLHSTRLGGNITCELKNIHTYVDVIR